ncbi:hypothetical protein Ahu01nite_021030 [Winogradskya humida]|uniref:MFS transporter n=1 Tax=Winogradskya humida TaxID=113566 RepID=A0ABQ3ZK88_9ACTN|nr:hypothetical protein Ahu01nite_021030 [Actinoplanes humidus]
MPENQRIDVPDGRDEAETVVLLTNAALTGVPAAYVISGSCLITAIATAAALCLVVIHRLAPRG